MRAVLYVHGDGLRVVDDETKGLIVDQTIEKVSFCAPDRNFERGFSYICRDGTTRRWMCHGFMANRESVSARENDTTGNSCVSIEVQCALYAPPMFYGATRCSMGVNFSSMLNVLHLHSGECT